MSDYVSQSLPIAPINVGLEWRVSRSRLEYISFYLVCGLEKEKSFKKFTRVFIYIVYFNILFGKVIHLRFY